MKSAMRLAMGRLNAGTDYEEGDKIMMQCMQIPLSVAEAKQFNMNFCGWLWLDEMRRMIMSGMKKLRKLRDEPHNHIALNASVKGFKTPAFRFKGPP